MRVTRPAPARALRDASLKRVAFPAAIRCHDINILLRDHSDSSEVPAKVSLDLGDGVAVRHQFADMKPFLVACCFDVTARNATKGKERVRLTLKRGFAAGACRVRCAVFWLLCRRSITAR